jgi:hypothetical protein
MERKAFGVPMSLRGMSGGMIVTSKQTMRGAAALMQSISSTGISASELKDGPSMPDASL